MQTAHICRLHATCAKKGAFSQMESRPAVPSPQYIGGPVPPQSNTMAITSLIVGLLTWTIGFLISCLTIAATYGIGSVVCVPLLLLGWGAAVVMGYSAIKEIRASHGQQTGDGMARAGVVMGWIGLGLVGVVVASLVACVVLTTIFWALASTSWGKVY